MATQFVDYSKKGVLFGSLPKSLKGFSPSSSSSTDDVKDAVPSYDNFVQSFNNSIEKADSIYKTYKILEDRKEDNNEYDFITVNSNLDKYKKTTSKKNSDGTTSIVTSYNLEEYQIKSLRHEVDTLKFINKQVLNGLNVNKLKSRTRNGVNTDERKAVAYRLGALIQAENKYVNDSTEDYKPVLLNRVFDAALRSVTNGEASKVTIYKRHADGNNDHDIGDFVQDSDGLKVQTTLLEAIGDALGVKNLDTGGKKIEFPIRPDKDDYALPAEYNAAKKDYEAKIKGYQTQVQKAIKNLSSQEKAEFAQNFRKQYLTKPGRALSVALMQSLDKGIKELDDVSYNARKTLKQKEKTKWTEGQTMGYLLGGAVAIGGLAQLASWAGVTGAGLGTVAGGIGTGIAFCFTTPALAPLAIVGSIWGLFKIAKGIHSAMTEDKPKDNCGQFFQYAAKGISSFFGGLSN